VVDNVTLLVIVLIALAIVVSLVIFFVSRRRGREQQERQEEARREYGSEYERLVEERGSEREAEHELRERRERLDNESRPLSEESRGTYYERWQWVERTFVDDPAASLGEADQVVEGILIERNFPMDSPRRRARGSASCTRRSSRTFGRPSGSTETPLALKVGRTWRRCVRPSRNTAQCTNA
jgi:hypothetical protein